MTRFTALVACPLTLAAFVILSPLASATAPSAWADCSAPAVAVCFTPGEPCDGALISAINSAKKTIRVAAYSFTSPAIADALIAARQRGVKVWVVMDAGQHHGRGSQGTRLRANGVGVRYDASHQLMHNKYVIVDIATTATGSYNFTVSAQKRNAENLLIIQDKETARSYARNWGRHWWHATHD